MAGDQDGEISAHQGVSSDRDASVAGRELHEHHVEISAPGAQGILVGENGTQVNIFVGQGPAEASAGPVDGAAGWLLGDVTDPFALNVHQPVELDTPQDGLPKLPVYLRREHDAQLERVVAAAAQGTSGIAVLVGGSSTGKTRACWEALQLLRKRPESWRLWHPIDPSRLSVALHGPRPIGARTVIWLDEAQLYLDAHGELGEEIAAGLRKLLREPASAPVLVLATLWPEHWEALAIRTGADDQRPQTRQLLKDRTISVPDCFTAAELRQIPALGDQRLDRAAESAADRRVVQFLAGAPELMTRYRNATSPARALMDAAIDARRMGMGVALPQTFLEAAAPGYLVGADWDWLGRNWLERALAYTAAPCNGIRGPLAPDVRTIDRSSPAYLLADYLDQHGRRDRRCDIPPEEFWLAAVRFADPGDLSALARAAENRGLLRDAARLLKRDIACGNATQAALFVDHWYSVPPHSADLAPAQWVATHANLDDPFNVVDLLDTLREFDADEQVRTLLGRDPAAHAVLDDPGAVALLLDTLRELDADEQVRILLDRDPAVQIALDDPEGVARLLGSLRKADANNHVTKLLDRDPFGCVAVNDPYAVVRLLNTLREAGADTQVTTLTNRAATDTPLYHMDGVALLLKNLHKVGASAQVITLANRAATEAPIPPNRKNMDWLLQVLHEVGASEQATQLLDRDPIRSAARDDPQGAARLLEFLRKTDPETQTTALANRAACVALDDPRAVAKLLDTLRKAGAGELLKSLLNRDPAVHAALSDPDAVVQLLSALRDAGANAQVTTLANRAAIDTPIDNHPGGTKRLLDALRKAGADTQVRTLIDRMPAEGLFSLFCEQAGRQIKYLWGRAPDGNPAQPWGWADLDRPLGT